jgi:dTDP-4-dehydrorhamnose reductase
LTDLIVGANGIIGSALMSYLSDAVGTLRKNVNNRLEGRKYELADIADKKDVESLFIKHQPKRVFLAAGITNVDNCELMESDKVNSLGVTNVITNCDVYNAQLIFFSSSYVFDGKSQTPYKPKDETDPINRYGRQKENIEKILLNREGLQYLIIRTVAVFGNGNNFVHQIVNAVKGNKKAQVPVDQTVNPVYAPDVAKTAIHLSERYSGEVFHVAGNRCLTYYDFAIQIAYKLGHKKPHDLIVGVKLDDMEQLARRPANACLDCRTLEAHALTVPNLEKGLDRFLEL